MTDFITTRARIGNLALTILWEGQTDDKTPGVLIHRHDYAELFFCLRGSLTIRTETGEVRGGAGETVLLPADLPHHSVLASEDCVTKVYGMYAERCADFGDQDVYGAVSPLLSGNAARSFRNAGKLSALLDEIIASPKEIACVFRTARFLEEFILAQRDACPEQSITVSRTFSEKERLRLVHLKDLINCEFTHDLTLTRAASLMYLSERQLARIVRREYGTTLRRVVIGKQLEAAAELLLSTDDSVEIIGQRVGFCAKSGFYRLFRTRYGMTPGDYRRTNGKPGRKSSL